MAGQNALPARKERKDASQSDISRPGLEFGLLAAVASRSLPHKPAQLCSRSETHLPVP